jgi:hypothetical protein
LKFIYKIFIFLYSLGLVYSQTSVPTIPSKYLTVITDNNENKGFHRSSKRFQNTTV